MPQETPEQSRLESHTVNPATRTPPDGLRGEPLPHFSARPVTQLFEAQVAKSPDAIAVVSEVGTLTFGELNDRANQLARHLRSLGATRETIVAISIDRSSDMAVAILGVLKSGAAYLPLDPDYPAERLAFMLNDSKPALVLAKSQLQEKFAAVPNVLLIDEGWNEIATQSAENLDEVPLATDLAYVIYTSGSTGNPKGVMIEHGNLANYLLALDLEIGINPADRYLHTASIAFSSARRQLLLPLSQGARVVIASSDQRKDPIALFRTIKSAGVTVMDAVPSFWKNCTAILAGLDQSERDELIDNQLRLMLSASEPLPSAVPFTWLKEFNHPARHVHMFGQTETAGIVSLYQVPETIEPDGYVPVGGPIANTDIYVLDEQGDLCERGEAGELYIGGAGVGRGYLNRPELTAHKFIERNGLRLYRTGDWARVSNTGRIEFAGRQDQQIKLRGFRVELGEIEAVLSQHQSIAECVVVARDGDGAEKTLVAYFVPRAEISAGELRNFLSTRVPDYSVPAAFVSMQALPLSANGKVDRLNLPAPANSRQNVSAEFVAPAGDIEIRMAAIWSEVLRVDAIGRNDDFFDLGGHSLLAAQISARIRREFNLEMPISGLFEARTVATLGAHIKSGGMSSSAGSIIPAERDQTAPLSFNQQQFWLLDQVSPDRSAYNVQTALEIKGPCEIARLQAAIDAITLRHEVLRTNIITQNGSPLQLIGQPQSMPIRLSDLSQLPDERLPREKQRLIGIDARLPFDLGDGPLWRAHLLKLSSEDHLLVITLHHIICDGWSINLLLRELKELYAGGAAAIPELPIQYADFAVWQRRQLSQEGNRRQLDYWKQQLADAPAVLDLPADYPRPATRTGAGERVSVRLSREETLALTELGRRDHATLFMTLLAAFQTLLFLYSSQEDIVVGSPVAGRSSVETELLIGAFVNTLVFRAQLSGASTFRQVLARIRDTVLEAFSHQDLPFEKLVEELNPERKANRSPLFQVMFSFQNQADPPMTTGRTTLSSVNIENEVAKFDLSLDVAPDKDGITVAFEYARDLYERTSIERMLKHFVRLLTAITSEPSIPVSDLSLVSDEERQQLLEAGDRRGPEVPRGCLHQLFEANAAKFPEACAAEFNGQHLSYRELNEQANQLANYLQKQGVGPESLVGVSVHRSLEMLVAIFGVLKAGAGYVPLDPNYPRERLAFMIEDTAMPVIVTQERLAPEFAGTAKIVCIDRDWQTVALESRLSPAVDVRSDNVALVIYTSGSTGNPKGVVIEHRSLVSYFAAVTGVYELNETDRVLQFGSLSFDMSVEEIFMTLSSGGTLVLRTESMISSAQDFCEYCDQNQISVLDLPTAYWHELTDALTAGGVTLPATLRLVIIGGEKAAADRVAAWNVHTGDRIRLLNSYGPTEITIAATVCNLKSSPAIKAGVVPIGRPLPNTTVYVLDESLRLTPAGVPGELYVGGPGVARGYLNQPELTDEKFIRNPFGSNPGDRLYKTGDVVRFRADGNLEFMGRVDNQVKLRGFRVELEEIERALRGLDSVADCVVVMREDHDKRLIAYVVPGNSTPNHAELRNHLRTKMPAYMVPASFELIDALPRLPNGKINRRALPDPQPPVMADESFLAPSTPMQQLLAESWCEVLRLDRVSIHDNFFDLGGHSLLAAKVVSLVRNELDVPLTMVDVFEAPTVHGLAELLCPRIVVDEARVEFDRLMAEIAAMSEEEAAQQINREQRLEEAAA